jgi:hypothetical protein
MNETQKDDMGSTSAEEMRNSCISLQKEWGWKTLIWKMQD